MLNFFGPPISGLSGALGLALLVLAFWVIKNPNDIPEWIRNFFSALGVAALAAWCFWLSVNLPAIIKG